MVISDRVRRGLAALVACTLVGCGSTERRSDGDASAASARTGVGEVASEPADPEAERAEAERVKAERRRVVDSTLAWIIAEAAARRESGAPPAPAPDGAAAEGDGR